MWELINFGDSSETLQAKPLTISGAPHGQRSCFSSLGDTWLRNDGRGRGDQELCHSPLLGHFMKFLL